MISPCTESGFVRLPDASKEKRRRCLDNNMVLSDAEALKMDRSAAADVLCGCAFCIVLTKTTTGSASGKKELIARGKVDK